MASTEQDEETPLLIPYKGNIPENGATDEENGDGLGTESTTSSVISEPPAEDIGPWPSTFERSISLLAGPKTDIKDIDRITRSPRFVPVQAAKARKKLKKLGRGYHTPDPAGQRIAGAGSPEKEFVPIKKTHSLDYVKPSKTSSRSDEQQQKKMLKLASAAAYRQKILASTATESASTQYGTQKKGKQLDEEEDGYRSPGYYRERDSDKAKVQQQKEAEKRAAGNATFSQCVFNMANILMGVGMLGLPYIFKSAGWIGGFLVTVGFAVVAWRTSILIGRQLNGDPRPSSFFDDSPYKSPLPPGSTENARMRAPMTSFPEIARTCFGQTGAVILSIVLYFELFSCLAIFYVSIGDHLHTIFHHASIDRLTLYTAFLLVVPTAVLRTPRLLSYLSLVGTIATVFVVLAVFFSAITEGDMSEQAAEDKGIVMDEPSHIMWNPSGLPLALGLIAYAFSGHAIVPSIYSSMERPQDFEKMIHTTFTIVLFCCLLVAISGYCMFGSMVDDQITISLGLYSDNTEIAMEMLTWLMILTAFSKFVLTLFPLALGTEEIIAPYIHSEKGMERVSSVIKISYIALSLLVALYVPSFSFMCSLVGLVCTMIVSVIFPAGAHIKMFASKLSFFDICINWFLVMGGIVATITGTIATI